MKKKYSTIVSRGSNIVVEAQLKVLIVSPFTNKGPVTYFRQIPTLIYFFLMLSVFFPKTIGILVTPIHEKILFILQPI